MTLYATHPLWNYAQFNYTAPDKGLTGNPHIDALITGYRWSEKMKSVKQLLATLF